MLFNVRAAFVKDDVASLAWTKNCQRIVQTRNVKTRIVNIKIVNIKNCPKEELPTTRMVQQK